ncbi:hypothetical protein PUMCH_004169 [Australozyma saopauloensis]|uniref:alpha-1,2-Mannosidase n=1 Tax=Australozyma saopauloensis TaxID=291208 RepID=A0AAX4HE57_9ASCO|nr:hypothetical protein PUMCH_004169 [[Candida] saopauloensis]
MNPFLPKAIYRRTQNEQNELPMFKDKPKQDSYFKSHRTSRKALLIRTVLSLLTIFCVYYLLKGSSAPRGKDGYPAWPQAQKEVKSVFVESWRSYEHNAWGKDIYNPISGKGKDIGNKPLGWMIVDLLDTLWLMGLKDEFKKARDWVKSDLKYNGDKDVSTFETTIRMLGGLLAAFNFSNDDVFLERAADLANAMLGAFESPSGLPYSEVNLKSGHGSSYNSEVSTAEVATLQLEFKYLLKLTGEELYWKRVEKVMAVLDANKVEDGLAPILVNADTGKHMRNLIRLGSRGDSYYEYLLKQYLQTKHQEPIYWQMYKESVEGVKKHLVGHSKPNGFTFIGELENGIGSKLLPKMDHLVCFYPGLLALGATGGHPLKKAQKLKNWSKDKEEDFKLAVELTESCYEMYKTTVTGLAGEIAMFNTKTGVESDIWYKPTDVHNLQRPETIESIYYMYKLTGDEKYRKWGYDLFRAFVKYTKYKGPDGRITYTCLKDVTTTNPSNNDNMESFWLAETLKYFYLLFDDENIIPLTDYVFNTEAHPLPRFDMEPLFTTGWQRDKNDARLKQVFAPAVGAPEAEIPVEPKRKDAGNVGKKPPKAAPAAKKIDEAVNEVIEDDPSIKKAEEVEKKKVKKVLDEIKNAADS